MFKEGDWIIDNACGLQGVVLRVFPDGITARFGGLTALRKNENVTMAPLDIQKEDLLAIQHLAVETGDYLWFCEISERIGVEMHG